MFKRLGLSLIYMYLFISGALLWVSKIFGSVAGFFLRIAFDKIEKYEA